MPESLHNKSLNYNDAGVDIDAGNELIKKIKPAVKRTNRPGVLGGLGGFGGLFELPIERYKNPLLVSGTDGVGTKLKLAIDLKQYNTIGIDLVAMCVNDVIVAGAEPLFFLDYLATGKLQIDVATEIIEGIADGCCQAGTALIGGETAEMPGIYNGNDFDLAGFSVGIVEKNQILDKSNVAPDDVLIGINSSGPHSNGYSLIRKILEHSNCNTDSAFDGKTLGEVLLEPTRIYVKSVLDIIHKAPIHALSHITGGGLIENLPRVLPDNVTAHIDSNLWQHQKIFDWLQQQGNINTEEMYRTFNCGIGMVVVIAKKVADTVLDSLERSGETAQIIGQLTPTQGVQKSPKVIIKRICPKKKNVQQSRTPVEESTSTP